MKTSSKSIGYHPPPPTLALFTAAVLALGMGPLVVPAASAQDQTAAPAELEEIIVTGSRIRRVGIDPSRPSISVGTEIFDRLAFTNIADALNELPAFGAGVDPEGGQNAFTVGQNYVDLFNLGTQRTLVLVNGKRFVSSNPPALFGLGESGLQVDLNAIPVALTERIETVPMAGAAVYGSDAIAGTVNVFLRDDYEGFEVSAQKQQTAEGDGDAYQMQLVFGFNFDDNRGNIAMSFENNRQAGLSILERDWLINENLSYEALGQRDLDGDGEMDDVDGDGNPENFRGILADGIVQVVGGGGGGATPTDAFRGFFAPTRGWGAMPDGKFYQFQQGDLVECQPAATEGTLVRVYDSDPTACGVHDFFEQSGQIRSPLDRNVFTASLSYDIFENITFKQLFIVATSEAAELANQGGFQTGFFSGESGELTVPANHPFISQQAKDLLANMEDDMGNPAPVTELLLHRYNNDLVSEGRDETSNLVGRIDFSLEGQFELNNRNLFWDVSAVIGRSDIETQGTGIIDGRFFNAVDAVRLDATSLMPITDALSRRVDGDGANNGDLNGDGTIDMADALQHVVFNGGSGVDIERVDDPVICSVNLLLAQQEGGLTDANGDPLPGPEGYNAPAAGGGLTDSNLPFSDGCVPLNLFSYGGSSSESLAFITGGPQYTRSELRQQVFAANLSGDILDLPAGPLAFGIGWENRTDKGAFNAGLDSAVPITRSAAASSSGGELEANEFYGEVSVPLISENMGFSFLQSAEIALAGRYVENTVTGFEPQTEDTFEGRILVRPTDWLLLRASTANAIRTASLVELFTPRSRTFVSGDDPCDRRAVTRGDNPDLRRANCTAHMTALNVMFEGMPYDPATFESNIQDGTISGGFSQGNAELSPETSESWSAGFVVNPLDDLIVAYDWFNVEIEKRITNFGWEELAAACYDDPSYPNAFCGQFVRDAGTGQISQVSSTWLNSASSRLVGSQLQSEYELGLNDTFGWDFGTLEFDFNLFFLRTDERKDTVTSPITDTSGGYAIPDWEGTFDTTWEYDKWRVFWRMAFQDEPQLDPEKDLFYLNRAGTAVVYKTDIPFIHDLSVSYSITEDIFAQLSIYNLLDRRPSAVEDARTYFGTDERLGRRFILRTRIRF